MNIYAIPEISDGIYAVGVIDWKRRVFDALAYTPLGTTYNCYLVKGKTKTALIDTVHRGFEPEWSGKIDQILGSHAIDYVVMNHAEPDHAGSIPYILSKTGALLMTTKKGAELAGIYYGVPSDRIREVGDGSAVDLGGKTLKFISAPFVHWPETMFTYIPEDKLLFPCDFFGSHNPTGFFDDEADNVILWAKRYYGEIMMPLAKMGRAALQKIKGLDIAFIAPSHGPIYRHPGIILDAYAKWTAGETAPKALIVYVSMYGHTERMAHIVTEELKRRDVAVRLFDLAVTDVGELPEHLVDSRAIVIASPTVLGGMHPLIQYAGIMIKTLRPPTKYGLFINSYGWGKSATAQGVEFLDSVKIENIGVVEVNAGVGDQDNDNLLKAAAMLADKILADGK
jgi:flavorubredoxin